jgi:membrane protease YdiL (CAAX protease family)
LCAVPNERMTDPTPLVLSGAFAVAAAVFVLACLVRAWHGRNRRNTPESAAVAGPSQTGKVPTWFYRPLDLLGVAVVFVVFGGLVLASLEAGAGAEPVLNPGALLVNIGFQFLMAAFVAVMVVRRVDLLTWLGLRWQGWPWLVLIAPGTVALMWLIFGGLQYSGYVEWMESLGVETVQDTVKLLQESKDPLVLGLMIFAAVIAAPLCEEVVFRGYMYPVLKKFGGLPVATVCSALVFAAAHGSLTALLPLLIFGCVLVFLYEKTGSLWAPIAAHFCFNAATVVVQMVSRIYEIPIGTSP